jgi:hypothetical protein
MSAKKPSKAPTSEQLHFDLTGLLFQSLGSSERLRVSVRRHSSRDAPAFAVWAERKSSKEQWELEVDDVAQHCDDTPVPPKVVLSRLKVTAPRARVCLHAMAAAWRAAAHVPRCRKRLRLAWTEMKWAQLQLQLAAGAGASLLLSES